jgi:protocatechuate 3,4-dioxygenase beta subunit
MNMNSDESPITGMAQSRGLIAAALAALLIMAAALILFGPGSDREGNGDAPDPTGRKADVREDSGEPDGNEGAAEPTGERILVRPRAAEEADPVRVHGRVIDPDGAPMAAVGVAFRRRSSSGEEGMLEAAVRSGGDGSYEIALSPGDYTAAAAVATQRRGHDLRFEPVRVTVPAAREFVFDIVFTRPRCRVAGSVTRPGGEPIEDVGVGLCTPDLRFLRRTATAPDGSFVFEGVASGTYRLHCDKGPNARRLAFPWQPSLAPEKSPDRWPRLVVEPADREIDLHLTMAAPVKVAGMVLARGLDLPRSGRLFIRELPGDSGGLVPGQRRLYSGAVKEDGSFFINDVFPGEYLAALYGLPDGIARPDPVAVRIDPFLPEQNLTVSFEASAGACRIKGRAADQEDRGLGGARVLVWDEDARPSDPALFRVFARAEAVCSADGAFAVAGLRPGRYLLARDRRVAPGMPGALPIVIDRARDLEVVLSGEEETGVLLDVLAYGKADLRGRVEGLDSGLSLRAVARFDGGDDFEEYRVACPAGRDGEFLLSYLPLAPMPVTVEVLTDLGDGREIPCARTDLILEEGENAVTLTRGE